MPYYGSMAGKKGKLTETPLEAYQQAVWDYVLEHGDITPSGALFVKFHTESKTQLEGHIYSRVRGYHRLDARAQEAALLTAQKPKEKVIPLADRLAALTRPEPIKVPETWQVRAKNLLKGWITVLATRAQRWVSCW